MLSIYADIAVVEKQRKRRDGRITWLRGMPVGRVDFKLGHQQQVEHTVTFIRLKDDRRPAGWRLSDKVWMRNLECPPVRHADRECTKGRLMQRRAKLVGGHASILPPWVEIASNANFRPAHSSALM